MSNRLRTPPIAGTASFPPRRAGHSSILSCCAGSAGGQEDPWPLLSAALACPQCEPGWLGAIGLLYVLLPVRLLVVTRPGDDISQRRPGHCHWSPESRVWHPAPAR